jgi:carbon monoxide dehydrogenase subunit G
VKIENQFEVAAPIDEVWAAMLDVDRVVACVPGASVLEQLGPDAYRLGMKVKVGPVSMQYRGDIEFVEKHHEAHRAVLSGKGKETRGQGTAEATSVLTLTDLGATTRCTVDADVKLSGRIAAMGQGIISDVADRIAGQFAGNLQTMLISGSGDDGVDTGSGGPHGDRDASAGDGVGDESAQPERSGATVDEAIDTAAAGTQHGGVSTDAEDAKSGAAPVEQARGDTDMTQGQVTGSPGPAGGDEPIRVRREGVSGAAQSEAGGRASDHVAATGGRTATDFDDDVASLDGLDLARTILVGRLKEPRVAAGVGALLALVLFLLGRRSAR